MIDFIAYKNNLKEYFNSPIINSHIEEFLVHATFNYCIPFYNRDIFSKILYSYRNKNEIKKIHKNIDDLIEDDPTIELIKSFMLKMK